MRNLTGLLLTIDGEFNDAFLYGDSLYLIDDTHLAVVDFHKLVESVSPEDPDKRVLMRYAFLRNDFFYKADSDFYDFFNLSAIKRFLESTFASLRSFMVNPAKLNKCTKTLFDHDHPGALHLEVYKSNVFISSDKGTFSYRSLASDGLKRKQSLLEFPAMHISAVLGETMYFSCGHNGFHIIEFSNLRERSAVLSRSAKSSLETFALSSDFAYRDVIIRDIENHFTYVADTSWNSFVSRRELSSEERVASYRTLRNQDFLKEAHFASSSGNRLIVFSNGQIILHRMEYRDRERDTSFESFHYSPGSQWNNILSLGFEIFSAYQTVFGLVLDTNDGTVVVDDDPDDPEHLVKRTISKDENVKVRHFYRSINYSHIVLSIKNNRLEIFADLTDYFFPRDKKAIRRIIPRRQAMGSY